jgi:hypothetical protein
MQEEPVVCNVTAQQRNLTGEIGKSPENFQSVLIDLPDESQT